MIMLCNAVYDLNCAHCVCVLHTDGFFFFFLGGGCVLEVEDAIHVFVSLMYGQVLISVVQKETSMSRHENLNFELVEKKKKIKEQFQFLST